MRLNYNEIESMRLDNNVISKTLHLFDIKRPSQTWADGVPTESYTVIETREMEFQPLPPYGGAQGEIEVGGVREIPQYHSWFSLECLATSLDYITKNSGTTHYWILRTYDYEDHKEADLIQKEP